MLAEMRRRRDEADYVLDCLQRAREEVLANPQWFTPSALERIEQAIQNVQGARDKAHECLELEPSAIR